MKVSTKGRYALRLMVTLAKNGNERFTPLKEIAGCQEISLKYLEQIVIQLNAAGCLKSFRGPQGGYKLAKPAAEYTVGSILRITEGPLTPIDCLLNRADPCPRYATCATVNFWEGLYLVINQYVDSFTLQDLLEMDGRKLPV